MIDLKEGETFVVVYSEDSKVDFRRDVPGYTGKVVLNYTDVGCLYYDNFYDYPLDGIGKNKYGYFKYRNSDTFRITEYYQGGTELYDVQEYHISFLTRKETIRCYIENKLLSLVS